MGVAAGLAGLGGSLISGLAGKAGDALGLGPSTPDYVGLTNHQTKANRPDVNGPATTDKWSQDAQGNWTRNVGLTGQAGTALNSLQGNMASAASMDPTQARQQAIDSNYSQATSRLDPQWQQTENQNKVQMANAGLDPGTEAYNAQAGNLSRSKNDAYTSAMSNAIQQGNQTQQTQMQQSMLPYQQYSSLLGSSMGSMPQTPTAGSAVNGAALGYQGATNSYNAGGMLAQGAMNGAGGKNSNSGISNYTGTI